MHCNTVTPVCKTTELSETGYPLARFTFDLSYSFLSLFSKIKLMNGKANYFLLQSIQLQSLVAAYQCSVILFV